MTPNERLKHWPDTLGDTSLLVGLALLMTVASAALCWGAHRGVAWLSDNAWRALFGPAAIDTDWVTTLFGWAMVVTWGLFTGTCWRVAYDETVNVWRASRRFDRSIERDLGMPAEALLEDIPSDDQPRLSGPDGT